MLDNWFLFRLDFINLWYGGAFFLLAIIAFMFNTEQKYNTKAFLPWKLFGFFATFYGLHSWFNILQVSFRNFAWLNATHVFFIASSFLCLYEFARRGSKYQEIKQLFNWQYISAFLIIGSVISYFYPKYFVFAIILAIGFPSVVQSVFLFRKLSRKWDNDPNLKAISTCMLLFYLLKLILLSKIYLCEDCFTRNGSIDNALFGWFYYIVVFAAATFIFNVWKYAKNNLKKNSAFFKGYYLPTLFILLLFAGFGLLEWRTKMVDDNIKLNMLRASSSIAKNIELNKLRELTYTSADSKSPIYESISRQLSLLVENIPNLSIAYILKKVGDNYCYGPIGLDRDIDANKIKAGDFYNINKDVLNNIFKSGRSIVVEPMQNDGQKYITAFVPIVELDENNINYAVVLDVDSEYWKIELETTRAKLIIGIMILLAFPFFAFLILKHLGNGNFYDIGRSAFLPTLIFIYGVITTILVSYFLTTINREKEQQDFYWVAELKGQLINEVFKKISLDLDWTVSYIEHFNGFANYGEFKFFASTVSKPLRGRIWKWLAIVPGSELTSFEQKIKSENGFEDFYVYELKNPANRPPVKPASYYFPIIYSYPEDEHNNTAGSDYNSEKNRSNAIKKILKTGLNTSIFPSDLASRYGQRCMMVIAPVKYGNSDKIANFLVQVLPIQEIIDNIMPSQGVNNDTIEFEIIDLEQENDISVLASYPKTEQRGKTKITEEKLGFKYIYPIFLFGRTLAIEIKPRQGHYNLDFINSEFTVAILGGLLLTWLITMFVTFLKRRQADLEKLVDERTKEVFKQEMLIKTISDNLPVVFYRCTPDEEMKFSFLSSEIINMCGLAPSDFIVGAKDFFDIAYPNDAEYIKKTVLEAVKEHRDFDIEYRVIGRGGKILWVNDRGHVAYSSEGTPLWIDGTIADITQRREATAKLNESLYELEKANSELVLQTEMSKQYAEEAKIANKAKGQFLASMSHEIRTPMNAIIGMGGLLRETELTDTQKKYTDIICSSSENLLTLIDDILDFSKMDAGKMQFEKIGFELAKCLDETLAMLKVRANEKKLELDFQINEDVPLYLKGDPNRLRQVIINLVSNAIKFTERGSVRVFVQKIQIYENDVLLKFVVSDTGIGIAKNDIKKLFKAFVQADGSTMRKYGGTGLGLAICKQIVELFNGKIGVESELGKGSDFWFTARFNLLGEDELDQYDLKPEAVKNDIFIDQAYKASKKILLVEDNEINSQVALAMLNKLGFTANVAINGEEAIKILCDKPYDLILMDCQMPGMDGFETCKYIRSGRAGERNSSVVIIAMTANVMAGDRKKCIDAGMNDYIGKPVKPEQLLDKLEKWLNNKQNYKKSIIDSLVVKSEALGHVENKFEGENNLISDENSEIAKCLENIGNSVLNKLELSKRMMKDEELIKNIMATFNNVAPNIVETLRFAVESENYELAKSQAHSLKGAAANISAEPLKKLAEELESYYIDGDYARAEECFTRLERAYYLLQREIY